MAFRAVAAVLVALVLWLLGHRLPAVVLLVVITLVTGASLRFAPVARALERAERVVQRLAGRALSLVLLGAVQLLVFTPLALVLRLVGHNPMALGSSSRGATFWRPVPRPAGRPLYRRPFSYERLPGSARRRRGDRLPLLRLRAALGLIALVALVDIGVGAAIEGFDDEPRAATSSLLTDPDVAAGRGEPWRHDLGREITDVWDRKRYHPSLGWTMPDYEGRYVHVVDGVRRSYQPAGATGADAVEVFFFGGSTMFGLFQRDERTIPSELAKLAEDDGITLRVVNHGALAYTNWQEMLLVERLVSGGSIPDLAVFYDGLNEVLGQFTEGRHTEPGTVLTSAYEELVRRGREDDDQSPGDAIYDGWADVSALHRVGRRLGIASERGPRSAPLQSPWVGDQADRPGQRGRYAASIYSRGVDVASRLADSYGFPARFFWQPFLYSKRPVAGEEALIGWLGSDPDAWRTADRVARSRLEPPAVDLSAALDGVDAPVMYDFVHTNERGADAVARALYERLRPRLRKLAER